MLVGCEPLADLVARDCALDILIAEIRAELAARLYEIIRVASGWQFRTRPCHAATLQRVRRKTESRSADLTERETLALTSIVYRQPVTRDALGSITGRTVSRTLIALRPHAPYTYVTTPAFLSLFGLDSLRDLPDLEALHDAGLLEDGGDMGMPVAEDREE